MKVTKDQVENSQTFLTIEMEPADSLVADCHFAFALKYMHFDRGLTVGRG